MVKNLISSQQNLKDCKQFYELIGTTKSIANIKFGDTGTGPRVHNATVRPDHLAWEAYKAF